MANPSKPLTFGLTILLSIYMYVTLAIVLFGAVYNLNYPFGGIWLVVILPFIGVAFIWKLYSDEQGETSRKEELRRGMEQFKLL